MRSHGPEEWARRWARFAGVCLLLGFLIPADRSWRFSDWIPKGEPSELSLFEVATLCFPIAGGACLFAAANWGSHGLLVAVLLGAAIYESVLLFVVLDALKLGLPRPSFVAGFYLGPAAVAVGSHLCWHHSASAASRWFSCLGGLVLGGSLVWIFSLSGLPKARDLVTLLILFAAGAYVVLGVLGMRRHARGSARLARWLGRATLVGVIGLVLVSLPVPWLPRAIKAASMLAGCIVLPPLAAAALCERRVARTADRTQWAEVFE